MNKTKPAVPFGLPDDQKEFDQAIRKRAAWLRKQFGAGISATAAIQDVLLRLLSKHEGGAELPAQGFWRSVTRVVFDQFRRQRRHERFLAVRRAQLKSGATERDETRSCESEMMAEDARSVINRAVATLSPSDQDLWSRLLSGEPYYQIGKSTGRNPSAVKVAAARLRLRIQNALPPEYRPARSTPRRTAQ